MAKPDFVVRATLRTGLTVLENVYCRIYLPRRVTDPIELHLSPTSEQAKVLSRSWKFSLEATLKDRSGKVFKRILAHEVIFDTLSTMFYDAEFSESSVVAEPRDLRVTDVFEGCQVTGAVQGAFWLTPLSLVEPTRAVKTSYDGSVEVSIGRQFEFMLDDHARFIFERHYRRYKQADDEETVLGTGCDIPI